jgi:hypothetical protein
MCSQFFSSSVEHMVQRSRDQKCTQQMRLTCSLLPALLLPPPPPLLLLLLL